MSEDYATVRASRDRLLEQIIFERAGFLRLISALLRQRHTMKIKLIVPSGELVHEATILPFNEPPQVITWGVRTFVRCAAREKDNDGDTIYLYEEAFAYAIPG